MSEETGTRNYGKILAIVVAVLVVLCGIGAVLGDPETETPETTTTEAPATTEAPTTTEKVTTTTAAPTTTEAPTTTAVPTTTAPPAPQLTMEQEAAIDSARSYLRHVGGFSAESLIGQLEYEGFSYDDASFAVFTLNVDFNEQAAQSAASYVEHVGGFSRSGLIDQLLYEGFTYEQAEYGVSRAGY